MSEKTDETLVPCDWCKGRGSYRCDESHFAGEIEYHENGRKECRRCHGTGKVAPKPEKRATL